MEFFGTLFKDSSKKDLTTFTTRDLETLRKEFAIYLGEVQAELLRRDKIDKFQIQLKKDMEKVKGKTKKNYISATESEFSDSDVENEKKRKKRR